jgi:hypothetical protein
MTSRRLHPNVESHLSFRERAVCSLPATSRRPEQASLDGHVDVLVRGVEGEDARSSSSSTCLSPETRRAASSSVTIR